jgi:hypothetical protein
LHGELRCWKLNVGIKDLGRINYDMNPRTSDCPPDTLSAFKYVIRANAEEEEEEI